MEYKPILAKWAQQQPGKMEFMTRDFPLEAQCNSIVRGPASVGMRSGGGRAPRAGKGQGRGDGGVALRQPAVADPELVKSGAGTVGRRRRFRRAFAATLQLVKGDIAQGAQLKVTGTPTFFMNGIRLPGLRGEFFDAAVAWELKQVQSKQIAWPLRSKTEELTKDFSSGSGARGRIARSIGLTLQVEAGEVFGFLGPNGAGKSTTLKLLMQLLIPTSGSAAHPRPARRRSVDAAAHRLPCRRTRTSTTT